MNDRQHDCTQGHMHTVKAGQHKECGTVDSRPHGEIQILIGMHIFHALEYYEDQAPAPRWQTTTNTRPLRLFARNAWWAKRDGNTGGEQQQGVDQRQIKRWNGLEVTTQFCRAVGGPYGLK